MININIQFPDTSFIHKSWNTPLDVHNNDITWTTNYDTPDVIINNRFLHPKLRNQFDDFTYCGTLEWQNANIYLYGSTRWQFPTNAFKVIRLMRELSNDNRYMNIYLCPIDTPKIYNGGNMGSTLIINSGMSNPYTNSIVIWRKEEMLKVLIHEMIHALDMDLKKSPSFMMDIVNLHPESYYHPNESACDTLTILILCVLNSIVNKVLPEDVFKLEVNWCLLQASRVLWWNKCVCFNDIKRKQFRQDCDMFSYYITKAAILFAIAFGNSEMLNCFFARCNKMRDFINVKNNTKANLWQHIYNSINNKSFQQYINRLLKSNHMVPFTMRMSKCELYLN
uniref:Uncharacterized protein n=1 Tax=Megaviridae environmental sample TaxID=1737588 RepID=A0A5J6VJL8_9VIRU|nr:MAG: hypothetical protein [Megaviridae environmental sample]